jgi:hypothetical protein
MDLVIKIALKNEELIIKSTTYEKIQAGIQLFCNDSGHRCLSLFMKCIHVSIVSRLVKAMQICMHIFIVEKYAKILRQLILTSAGRSPGYT